MVALKPLSDQKYNVEDDTVFLTRKVLNSDYISIVSYKQEMRKSLLPRNHKT